MKTFVRATLLLACLLLAGGVAFSQPSPPPGFQNEIVVTGLDQPTTLEFTPDGRMLVGELQEYIFVVPPGAGQPSAQLFLQLDNTGLFGAQGLMDIELDPDFDANGYFYVFYVKGSLNRNRVSRFTAIGNQASPGSEVVIWQDIQPALEEHHGGAVAFGPDGKLYISVGEAFVPDDAQRMTSYRGKMLRLNRDGTIPADNPFHDGNGSNLDAIWALGLRNPFQCIFDVTTGRFFIADVGGNNNEIAMEELNLGLRGANYGWPDCEGGCSTPGFTNPIYSYPHNGRDAAIIGGFIYRGSQFPSAYYGNYFFADYAQNWFRRLTFDTNGNVSGVFNFLPIDGSLDADIGDPTCLKQGPDGAIYYSDYTHDPDNFWAMIRRIRYVGSNQPPLAFASAVPTAGEPPLLVDFSSAGSTDPEGQPLSYEWTFGDGQTSTAPNPSHTYQQSGRYLVRLSASDGANTTLSDPLTIVVGNPPTATILNPESGTTFSAGDVIQFNGLATDTEDGALPPGALNWTILFHHGTHIHPVVGNWSGTNQGTFTIPPEGHPFGNDTSYEILLLATDSSGLQGIASVTLQPDLVNLAVDTQPSGLTVRLDGLPRATPFIDPTVKGYRHSIEAPNQQMADSNFLFQVWSDGGDQTHTLVVPTHDLSVTATYFSAPAGSPVILSATRLANEFQLRFNSILGRQYRVERSETMLPGSWAFVSSQLTGTGFPVQFTDTAIGNAGQLFYRVVLLPGGSSGPPGFLTAAETSGLDVSALNVTVNSSGDNRLLLAGLCWNDHDEGTIPFVTYNGVVCTPVLVTNWFYSSGKLALYSLVAPAAGDHALQVTMSASVPELSVSAMILTNVNQVTPIGPAQGHDSVDPVTDISVSVPSTANDLVVDLLGYYSFDPLAGAGQTERIVSLNYGNASNRMSTRPGAAGTTSMSWSLGDATELSLIGVAINGL
jgi:glucose/arabinose dehydrogenase/PKD repeat protein